MQNNVIMAYGDLEFLIQQLLKYNKMEYFPYTTPTC